MKEHLKRVAKVYTGTTPPTNINRYYDAEDVLWFSPGDISSDGIGTSEPRKISMSFFDECGIKQYPAHSVLMVGIGATVGKVGYSDRPFYTNQQINTIVFDERKVLPKYGAYFLLNKSNEINKKTPIVTLQIFNQSKVKQLLIDYPSIGKQQRIVDYLDEKLAKINGRIEVLEKQQDAYVRLKKSVIHQAVTRGLNPDVRLKASGIEWIGMIPEHWEVKRIKEVGKLKLGKMLDEKPKDGYVLKPYLKSKNIGWLELKLDEVEDMLFSESEMNMLRLHEGDIVISEGGEVGKSAYWTGELQECYIQNSVQKLTLNKGYCSKYYLYLSFLLGQMGYYKSIVNLVSIMHLTYEKLRKVVVLCPPLFEQQAIANYLDEKCAKIDAAIENIGKQIDASKRLKRALINEVITGQRAV